MPTDRQVVQHVREQFVVIKQRDHYTEGNQIGQRPIHVGQMLTLSGIDELPQLINVLRGEMSIFGRRNVYRWPGPISCCSSGGTDQKRKRKND